MTLADLNAASDEEFCASLDGLWEHSPWIVKSIVSQRPFADLDALTTSMWTAVTSADDEAKLALLRAHPDLAGKLVLAGGLTPESTNEQASAGLDRLTKNEFKAFSAWNDRYRYRFGFPFILCVRGHDKSSIRAAFRRRLGNSKLSEFGTALEEVRKIAELRLNDRLMA